MAVEGARERRERLIRERLYESFPTTLLRGIAQKVRTWCSKNPEECLREQEEEEQLFNQLKEEQDIMKRIYEIETYGAANRIPAASAIPEVELTDEEKRERAHDTCIICSEEVDELNPMNVFQWTSCRHGPFHKVCLQQWRDISGTLENGRMTFPCPVCRAKVTSVTNYRTRKFGKNVKNMRKSKNVKAVKNVKKSVRKSTTVKTVKSVRKSKNVKNVKKSVRKSKAVKRVK